MSTCKVCGGYGYISGAGVAFPSPDQLAQGGIEDCPACCTRPNPQTLVRLVPTLLEASEALAPWMSAALSEDGCKEFKKAASNFIDAVTREREAVNEAVEANPRPF